jgi:hypothetical protein
MIVSYEITTIACSSSLLTSVLEGLVLSSLVRLLFLGLRTGEYLLMTTLANTYYTKLEAESRVELQLLIPYIYILIFMGHLRGHALQ